MPNDPQPFQRIFIVKKNRISDLVTKIGIIFVVRDPFGLRATANSPDLSCGSLIVKIKTLPMADLRAARPSVLYLALCIVYMTSLCFKGMHNAKYKTEGLAALKSAIGKVFVLQSKSHKKDRDCSP